MTVSDLAYYAATAGLFVGLLIRDYYRPYFFADPSQAPVVKDF